MTVITAIVDAERNEVCVGCNDRAILGNIVSPSADDKWLAREGWLIGITGTGPKVEALQALAADFPRKAEHPFEILRFMKRAYEEFDIGETEEGLKRYCGSGVIAHKSGAIWDFDNSFCVTEVERGGFWARGSGMDMAIGAGAALREYVSCPRALSRKVLEIVIDRDVDCPGAPLLHAFDGCGALKVIE